MHCKFRKRGWESFENMQKNREQWMPVGSKMSWNPSTICILLIRSRPIHSIFERGIWFSFFILFSLITSIVIVISFQWWLNQLLVKDTKSKFVKRPSARYFKCIFQFISWKFTQVFSDLVKIRCLFFVKTPFCSSIHQQASIGIQLLVAKTSDFFCNFFCAVLAIKTWWLCHKDYSAKLIIILRI